MLNGDRNGEKEGLAHASSISQTNIESGLDLTPHFPNRYFQCPFIDLYTQAARIRTKENIYSYLATN